MTSNINLDLHKDFDTVYNITIINVISYVYIIVLLVLLIMNSINSRGKAHHLWRN